MIVDDAGATAELSGRHSHAVDYASQALAEYATASPEHRAWSDVLGTHTDLAVAHVNSGDLDGAVDALGPVLSLPISQRIHGMLVSLRKVHRAITVNGIDSLEARILQQEIEAYCRTPAAALPH